MAGETMVEIVARALAGIYYDRTKRDKPRHEFPAGHERTRAEYIEALWIGFEEDARAAIAALREPTDEMVEAMDRAHNIWIEGPDYSFVLLIKMMFRAAIDAALKEKG